MPAIDTTPAAPAASEQIVDAFDLRQMRSAPGMRFSVVRPRCPESRPGEIVVCAPDPDRERVLPLPQEFEMPSAVPRLEMKLDENTTADLHLQAEAFPNGTVSNRVMVGVKRKF
ncbi:MAG: hypothetical protein K0R64_2310 [Novosphingobium lindaniclasticum]|jgi:hypothetical protein|uniref:Uncharacterized protein n=1 Tax=Novosphingobium lindaniclasticum LE124 TaxID=1096930 RepID=T0HS15_9SPHN|nr:hypothetical protein [Novosphingobium lindaniclasticum]EQB15837.1 hypothetical protein L284_10530 [Novosphingobium lindaniclasticum LE124]MDF2639326.1 hypothetical protein [Novosphingobium lindaniclasticum]